MSGVPQGPVLFIISTNDIDFQLSNFITKFADKTKIENSVITQRHTKPLEKLTQNLSMIVTGFTVVLKVSRSPVT